MNHRTRFMNCLRGRKVDRLPFVERCGMPWCFTASQAWHKQGIPVGSEPRLAFGFDCADVPEAVRGFEAVPCDFYAVPRYEEYELPDQQDEYQRRIDGRWGRTVKRVRARISTRVFENPLVHNHDEWLEFRKHFAFSPDGRLPDDWSAWAEHSRSAEHPIALELLGGFSALTNVIGMDEPTGMLTGFFDNPELIHDIAAHFVELNLVCADKVLDEARVDFVIMGDQIAGDDRPLISPRIYREFFLPGYRRTVEFLRGKGMDVILYGADGNVLPFVDMLMDIGVNGFMGVPEKMELPGLLEKYGGRICIVGGVDRWALLRSPEEIEAEAKRKAALAAGGRVIPCVDGSVMPETSLENYRHYARCLRCIILTGCLHMGSFDQPEGWRNVDC